MITPQQCLAGLFFLAAALALVGFFGLFFAMAHVRLVIPLAIIAKMLRARVTALPNSRAALSFISFQLPSKTGFVASKIVSKTARSRLFDTARGKEAVLIVCHNSTGKDLRPLHPCGNYSHPACTAATSHSRVATSHSCNGNERQWHQER